MGKMGYPNPPGQFMSKDHNARHPSLATEGSPTKPYHTMHKGEPPRDGIGAGAAISKNQAPTVPAKNMRKQGENTKGTVPSAGRGYNHAPKTVNRTYGAKKVGSGNADYKKAGKGGGAGKGYNHAPKMTAPPKNAGGPKRKVRSAGGDKLGV